MGLQKINVLPPKYYGNRKLNERQVLEIKILKGTTKQCNVARQFNVSKTVIKGIWNGETYKNVI